MIDPKILSAVLGWLPKGAKGGIQFFGASDLFIQHVSTTEQAGQTFFVFDAEYRGDKRTSLKQAIRVVGYSRPPGSSDNEKHVHDLVIQATDRSLEPFIGRRFTASAPDIKLRDNWITYFNVRTSKPSSTRQFGISSGQQFGSAEGLWREIRDLLE